MNRLHAPVAAVRVPRLLAALTLAILTALPIPAIAQAPASSSRVLVLEPAGDTRLARRHGAAVRDRASATLTTRGLVPARGPSGCSDPDCAAELLSADAADYALAIAPWGRAATCERVAVTLVDDHGVAHGGEVAVTANDLPAAVDAALAAALEHAASGGAQLLRVTGTPADATITLDRIPWGALPHEDRVPHGEHALAVSADGFVTERRTVTVGTEPLTVEIALTRAAPEPVAVAPQPVAPVVGPDPEGRGGDDAIPLFIGGGALSAAGVGLLIPGVYGFATPDGAPAPPDYLYERTSVAAAGTYVGVGAAALGVGIVLFVVAAGSTGRPRHTADARPGVVLRF